MDDPSKQLQLLLEKARQLEKSQENLKLEIHGLRSRIEAVQANLSKEATAHFTDEPVSEVLPEMTEVPVTQPEVTSIPSKLQPKEPTRWEEFIGTNLLNKIGIAILVIGIGFGVKYAIDHELLNPLTRIILGYIAGSALLVIAIRIKKDYENFSAVLLSGGMASLYFVTYAAYDFYALIPQALAFALMVLFTVFTVIASLMYNLQLISVIGLVGAYAVPFLLRDNSGKAWVMFSYMLIINAGILTLSFLRNWKALYYTAFVLTWIIILSWYVTSYQPDTQFWIAMVFSAAFFVLFYIVFLAYKLIRHEAFGSADIAFTLFNSFLVFGIGYSALSSQTNGDLYLGLFTLCIAFVHFAMCIIIFRSQERYKDIFFFVAGMVLTFLTIAIPVQLEGNWVTLTWAAEAVLLFWIGRTKNFRAYEIMAYPLIALAFMSLVQDWETNYSFNVYYLDDSPLFTPFLNIHFGTSLWVCAALFLINRIHRNPDFVFPIKHSELKHLINYGIPGLFLVCVYSTFYNEIGYYWEVKHATSAITISTEETTHTYYNYELLRFKSVWLINYSAIFGIVLSFLALRWQGKATISLVVLYGYAVLASMMVIGLYEIADLRASYMFREHSSYYERGAIYITIRYIMYACTLPLLWFIYRLTRPDFFTDTQRKAERIILHLIVLAVLSSELVHWLDLANVADAHKLGLSILWGIYASALIVTGLTRNQRFMRITGMVIFGVTVVKLFLYDMAGMSTIYKTIVMIILGALMLVSSFLYNRSKKLKTDERS